MPPRDKEIMGVRLSIPTDPPGAGEPTPPRAPAQQPAQRVDSTDDASQVVSSEKAPYSRKDSPPQGIRIESKWGRVTMPHVALVAVLTTLGGWFGQDAVSKGEQAELAEVLVEMRAVRKDVAEVKADTADLAKEVRKSRTNDKVLLTFVDDTVVPMVASLRKLGVKLHFEGPDRAADVDFHPPPGPGSTAPPIQPRAALPERPAL